jgi:hypothetical protein
MKGRKGYRLEAYATLLHWLHSCIHSYICSPEIFVSYPSSLLPPRSFCDRPRARPRPRIVISRPFLANQHGSPTLLSQSQDVCIVRVFLNYLQRQVFRYRHIQGQDKGRQRFPRVSGFRYLLPTRRQNPRLILQQKKW